MSLALVVIALAVTSVAVASKVRARRRFAKLKVSGGRKSLALNLFGRARS